MKFSQRIQAIQPSPTLAITSKAKSLIAQGVNIINFGAGEPDFDTPEVIRDAAKTGLDAGHTRYTPASGTQALRTAIAKDYALRQRFITAEQVIVSTGGKYALYNATQVLFDERDRVLIPTPYWVSYPAQIELANAIPIFVPCDASTDFKLTAKTLQAHLEADPDITGLILCSPSNPTGALYSKQELIALAKVLALFPKVIIFFDAMYDRLCYDNLGIAPDLVASAPELEERVMTFNGFSKTYAMTGWRLGYAIGPKDAIAAMGKLQSQSTSNPTSFAQDGAIAALSLDDSVLEKRRLIFERRRNLIVSLLRNINGVTCSMPQGAFYVFPDFGTYIDSGWFDDDLALSNFLLDEAGVAVVPGSAFGAPGHIRLSYATSDELIEEGISRIHNALQSKH